jgi:hypothetical protein
VRNSVHGLRVGFRVAHPNRVVSRVARVAKTAVILSDTTRNDTNHCSSWIAVRDSNLEPPSIVFGVIL